MLQTAQRSQCCRPLKETNAADGSKAMRTVWFVSPQLLQLQPLRPAILYRFPYFSHGLW
jgi:hypothetical protein